MKNICTILLMMLSFASAAQQTQQIKPLRLVAKRNNSTFHYTLGTAVRIVFIKEGIHEIIKGKLIKALPGKIFISPFEKDTLTAIAADSILSVKKLSRKFRLVTGIIMGTSFIGALTINENNKFSTAILILAVIPGVFASYGFAGSYLLDFAGQKFKRNGWAFVVE